MDIVSHVGRIFEYLESGHVENAVMACVRVARVNRDYVNAAIFLRELYPDRYEVEYTLYDDTAHLKPEARKFISEKSLERWIQLHTIEELAYNEKHLPEEKRRNVLKTPAGEIDAEIEQWEKTLLDLQPPQGMSSYDAAAFAGTKYEEQNAIRLRIKALYTLKARIKTRCLNYAIQIERQFDMQEKSEAFLWNVQNDVNNYFKTHSDNVFEKLQKATQLSTSTNTEDASLLLTEVRRTLKAVADHFFPAKKDKILCSDGKERFLGEEQYMNRLEEFLCTKLVQSTAKDLALAELRLLSTFIRRLNEMASKGVHADVRTEEARQGLLGLYMFLFNLCQTLTVNTAIEPK